MQNRSLFTSLHVLMLVLLLPLCLTAQSIDDNLQAKFEFTDGSLADGSPNEIDGTGFDLVATTGVEGLANGAYEFNGTSSYIDCGTDDRNIIDRFTVSAWMKTTSTENGRQMVVSKYHFEDDRGYYISMFNQVAAVGGRDGSGTLWEITSGDIKVNDGRWHHIVFVADRNLWSLYLDCQLISTLNTGTANPDFSLPDPLTIGKTSVSTGDGRLLYFDGAIDNVLLYDIPLSIDQIRDLSTCLQADFQFTAGSLADSSPNAIDGTGFSITPTDGIDGSPDDAFLFDGSTSYIDAGTSNRNIKDQLTISAWIKTTDGNRQIFVSKLSSAGDIGYSLGILDGEITFEVRDSSGTLYRVTSNGIRVDDGLWHHVVGTIDVNLITLYLDCEFRDGLSKSTIDPVYSSNFPLIIGRSSDPNLNGVHRYFNGSIDEVKLYNIALSEEQLDEISVLACPGGSFDPDQLLMAYYPLDNGNALDESGNGNHGTLDGPVIANDRFGHPAACLEFDGENDYIQVPHAETLNFGTGPFAVSLWLQADDPDGGPQMVVHKGVSGTGPQIWLRVDDFEEFDPLSRLKGTVTEMPPGTPVSTSSPVFDDLGWHHVIFQRTSTHLELWVDGTLVASLADMQYRNVNSMEQMLIGAQTPWPEGGNFPFIHNHFDGRLDEIRLYRKALSEEEIALLADIYCPEDIVVDADPDYYLYQASGMLSTSGSVTVSQPTIFQAGNKIVLSDGFSVEPGSPFWAKIEDCSTDLELVDPVTPTQLDLVESNLPDVLTDEPEFTVVPNPFSSDLQLTMDFATSGKASLQLMDMNGRRIQLLFTDRPFEAGEHSLDLDVSGLTPGMYLLHLRTAGHQLTKKIVKIR